MEEEQLQPRWMPRGSACPCPCPQPVPVPGLCLHCFSGPVAPTRLNLLALGASGDVKATPGAQGGSWGSQAHTLLLEVVGRGQASRGSWLSRVP